MLRGLLLILVFLLLMPAGSDSGPRIARSGTPPVTKSPMSPEEVKPIRLDGTKTLDSKNFRADTTGKGVVLIPRSRLVMKFAQNAFERRMEGGRRDPWAPEIVADSPADEASVIRLPDGTLKIFWIVEGRHCASIASHDHGRTWREPVVEFPVPQHASFTARGMLDREGELHLCFLVGRGVGNRRPGVDLFYDIWHARTTHGRKEWERPKRIFAGYVGALRAMIQLDSGRILLPFGQWVAEHGTKKPTGSNHVRILFSDDGGSSWKKSPAALTAPVKPVGGRIGAVEPTVLELNDGKVWMLIRTDSGRLYESYSKDGVTWSSAAPSRFASSESPARLLRLPDGRIVLIWNNCRERIPPPGRRYSAYSGRDVLHAAISEDDGRTWRGFREILRDPKRNQRPPRHGDRGTAYPDAAVTGDGCVLVVTGQGKGRRVVLRFHPDWLCETTRSDDFSDGLDGWCVFQAFGPLEHVWQDRGPGAKLVTHPTQKSRRCLLVRKTAGKPGQGAVWNFPMGRRGRLSMRLMVLTGFQGGSIALTDRFFDPGDPQGEHGATFILHFASESVSADERDLRIEPNKWHTLTFAWNLETNRCSVTLDQRPAKILFLNGEPLHGVSYLRLRSTARRTDTAGFLVESVSVTVDRAAKPADAE